MEKKIRRAALLEKNFIRYSFSSSMHMVHGWPPNWLGGQHTHLQQTRTVNEYTHEWEVLATRFPNLMNDQLLKLNILGLKSIICSELKLSTPRNLVEARSMARIIERKVNTQHGATIITKSSSYSTSIDNKYVHLEKEKKEGQPLL